MLDWKVPLTLDGVIDRGLALFKANLKLTLPLAIGVALIANLTLDALLGPHQADLAALVGAGDPATLVERYGKELLAYGVVALLTSCVVLRLVGALGRGLPEDPVSATLFVLKRVPHLLIATVLISVFGGAGLALFLLPGLWLLVSFSFTFQAVLFDGHDGVRALGASFRLVRGQWWRTLALYCVLILGSMLALIAFGLASGIVVALLRALGLEHPLIPTLIGAVAGGAIGLVIDSVLVAWYHDLGVRAGVAGGSAPPAAPGSIAV